MPFYLIDIFSEMRPKDIKLFTELYQNISNEFSYIVKPKNEKLAVLLYNRGFKFENFKSEIEEEEILNLYSTESPLFYIAWDKVDDLKRKFPNLDIDKEIDNKFIPHDLKNKFPNLDINHGINKITPLDCAIKYGSELCFNYLKNLGAYYTKKSEEYAIQGGNQNIFMQMIEDGKSFDKMLNIALDYQQHEISEYLKSNFGQTHNSIAESMYFGNYDVASYLLSNGADINDIYCWILAFIVTYESPLSIAIKINSLEIAKFLVEHGADINLQLGPHDCPLSVAIKEKSIEIVKFLVEHGADTNMMRYTPLRSKMITPLCMAIKANSTEIVKILVEHGADVNMPLGEWGCPITTAVKKNSLEIVKFLVEHGANVNAKIVYGEPTQIAGNDCPLSIAIKKNSIEIVKFLVKHGADVNLYLWRISGGVHPLDIAIKEESTEIVKFLTDHGAKSA